MSIKSNLAIFLGKFTRFSLKSLGRNASSLPGHIALKLDKTILKTLAKDYDVIVVTGTNGKTLTTALTTHILSQKYQNILTNSTGSNMSKGIVSAFLGHEKNKHEKNIAILEIDEAYLTYMSKFLNPKAIVVTNIFRDQLDRFGEIYTTYQKIVDGILKTPQSTLILNGDAPIFNSVALPNPIIYYGFNNTPDTDMSAPSNTDNIICPKCKKILRYKSNTYANLGKYYCPYCNFKRPNLAHQVTQVNKLTLENSTFEIDNYAYTLPIAGLYNIYNALAAYSVGKLFNLDNKTIETGFSTLPRVFGRQEVIDINGKSVLINLIKNPVGLNQVLDLLKLQTEDCSMITLLNDNYADGQDVSWIWDGQYETLTQLNIKQLVVGGKRYKEMLLRLEVAGFSKDNIIVTKTIEEVLEQIKKAPTEHINILATYTAMLELRKVLFNSGYVKGELQ